LAILNLDVAEVEKTLDELIEKCMNDKFSAKKCCLKNFSAYMAVNILTKLIHQYSDF